MRILFVTLHVRPSPQAQPVAAACLAAAVAAAGIATPFLVDLFPGQRKETAAILQQRPDVVAFSLYCWNREEVTTLARSLRQEQPDLLLVAGGPEVTAGSADLLVGDPFDALVYGDGEDVLPELLRQWQRHEELNHPCVRTVKNRGGRVNSARVELAGRPSPWLQGILVPREGAVLWEISRGCPYACSFCFDARGGKGVRSVDMARLEAELKGFVAQGVHQIWVLDSTFNYPRERALQLLTLFQRVAPRIHYHLEVKAQGLDATLVRQLSRLSCSLQIGLQSADPVVLAGVNRPFAAEKFSERLHLLNRQGITFGLDLIYGLPGDSPAGFARSINFALAFAPNHLEVFPLALLPGTPLHREAAERGLRAELSPPYSLLAGGGWEEVDLAASARLARAVDIFYNIGRATAFFPELLAAATATPAELLTAFAEWLESQGPDRDLETMTATEALEYQQGFIRAYWQGKPSLAAFLADLARYHYHYAETLLAPPLTVPVRPASAEQQRRSLVRVAPAVALVRFSCPISEWLEGQLSRRQLLRHSGQAHSLLFFQVDQVYAVPLSPEEDAVLARCDGRVSLRQLLSAAGSVSLKAWIEELVALGVLVLSGETGGTGIPADTGDTPGRKLRRGKSTERKRRTRFRSGEGP